MRFWDWVDQYYLPQILSYLHELRKRNYTVIACKGVADSDREAKAPINIPKGYTYEYARSDILLTESTIKLVESKRALAFGIPGAPNKILWLDLEARAIQVLAALYEVGKLNPDREELEEVLRELDPEQALDIAIRQLEELGLDLDKVYVEKTANLGLHIAVKVEPESYTLASSISGVKPYLDNKLHGYVVAYPCVLAVRKERGYEVLPYEKLSEVDLWETAELSSVSRHVTKLVEIFRRLGQEVVVARAGVREEYDYEYVRVPDEIAELVRQLDIETALLYFLAVCQETGCIDCVQYYVVRLLNNEEWDVKNLTYPIKTQRGLHFVLENELLGAMYLLGFSNEQIYTVAARIRYRDYQPETPPVKTAENIVRYGLRWVSVALSGACPFMIANMLHGRPYVKNCRSKLCIKISNLIRDNLRIILDCIKRAVQARERLLCYPRPA